MSDQGNPRKVGSCRIDITGAGTAVFLANSGAFETLTAAGSVATLTVPAAGQQIDQVSDVFIASGEGTILTNVVIERVSATQISVRLRDDLGALLLRQCAIDWYTLKR